MLVMIFRIILRRGLNGGDRNMTSNWQKHDRGASADSTPNGLVVITRVLYLVQRVFCFFLFYWSTLPSAALALFFVLRVSYSKPVIFLQNQSV